MRIVRNVLILEVAFVLFAVSVGTLAVSARPQVGSDGIISGRVVNSSTGESINGATAFLASGTTLIQLTGQGRNIKAEATTGEGGRFKFDHLQPGTYRLLITSTGYASREYGQENPYRPGGQITVQPQGRVENLTISLTATGSLSGSVTSSDSAGLEGFLVTVVRPSYNIEGQRILEPVIQTKTGNQGEYQVQGLVPGKYYVAARPQGVLPRHPNPTPGGPPIANYVVTYSPSTEDAAAAAHVDVYAAGRAISNIRMQGEKPLLRIKGRFEDPVTGKYPDNLSIGFDQWILPSLGSLPGTGSETYNSANGTFEIRDLEPGIYLLKAKAPPSTTATPTVATLSPGAVVRLTDSDVSNVVISPLRLDSIGGEVRVIGQPKSSASALRVQLRPVAMAGNIVMSPSLASEITLDGKLTFKLRGRGVGVEVMTLGEYRAIVSGIPDGFYLSQVQLNGADVTNKPFQFSAIGADNLNVFLQAGASRVTGIVHDAAGKPMSDADVALFPYQQPEQFSRIVVGRSDSNGQFRFSGLAPGTYQLFAWDGIEAYGHFDQELRTRSESRSLRVVVAVGQTVDVELRGIRIADLR